jgi:hypothetical protein
MLSSQAQQKPGAKSGQFAKSPDACIQVLPCGNRAPCTPSSGVEPVKASKFQDVWVLVIFVALCGVVAQASEVYSVNFQLLIVFTKLPYLLRPNQRKKRNEQTFNAK